jgi:hypothetical protein
MAYTTINKPTVYFDTRLYTGTGAENVVSDLGFNPDFAWFKKRSAAEHHFLYDQVRGALKKIATSNTNAEFTETQTLKSFGTNGYTLGTSAEVNGSATTYAAWNWKAGTTSGLSGGTITPTSYSISAATGFGIYKYTGTGSAGTIAHGLGTPPRFIMVKKTSGTADWAIYYNPSAGINNQQNRAMGFNTSGFSTNSAYWNGTAATSSVFSIGTQNDVNQSSETYIAYAFADVTGYQKFCGWYVNANADGPFIYTGFKPAFFLMFNINNSGRYMIADNKRNPFNEKDKKLSPHNTNAEATTGDIACDFLSNGIKVRGSATSDVNHTNLNMMYGLAIAAEPFVGSNNIAATAG